MKTINEFPKLKTLLFPMPSQTQAVIDELIKPGLVVLDCLEVFCDAHEEYCITEGILVVIVGVEINVLVTLTLWVEIFLVSNKELMLLKFIGIPLDSEETVGFVNML